MRTVFKVVTGEGDADASDSNAFSSDPLDMDTAPRSKRPAQAKKTLTHEIETVHSTGEVQAPSEPEKTNVEWFIGLVEAFLPMASTTGELEKYWHDNEHNIDAVKEEDPESYQRIVNMFKVRKLEIKKGK
jgi:hypothetical protein